ncbi:MAG: hypothetical protein ABIK92_12720 [Pseudomonadota bacterium]
MPIFIMYGKYSSVALHKLTGISFTTSPVVDVEQFDKLIGDIKDI